MKVSTIEGGRRAFDRLVPNTSVWLEGSPGSAAQVGARGYSYPAHEEPKASAPLDAYVLVLYVGGRTAIRRVIGTDEESCEVEPGDLSLVSPSVEARWGWAAPIDVLHVYFERAYLRDLVIDELGAVRTMSMRHGLRVTDEVLTEMGLELIEELKPPRPFASSRYVRAVGERMAIHLLRRYFDLRRVDDDPRAFTRADIAVVRALVDARMAAPIDVAEMARAVGLEVVDLVRAFRNTFGQSPQDYVREQRLERARELLVSTPTSISEIAAATGFADQSHLTRHFKRRFGSPPAQLRQRERGT